MSDYKIFAILVISAIGSIFSGYLSLLELKFEENSGFLSNILGVPYSLLAFFTFIIIFAIALNSILAKKFK